MKAKLNKLTKRWEVIDNFFGSVYADFSTRAEALRWMKDYI